MDSVFKVQKCLSSDPVESKVQAAVQQSNLTFPAPVVDSGRGCGMQDNQLSIVEKIQSLWSANSSEILIIISTVGLDNMVIRVSQYHPTGFTEIYFNTLTLEGQQRIPTTSHSCTSAAIWSDKEILLQFPLSIFPM